MAPGCGPSSGLLLLAPEEPPLLASLPHLLQDDHLLLDLLADELEELGARHALARLLVSREEDRALVDDRGGRTAAALLAALAPVGVLGVAILDELQLPHQQLHRRQVAHLQGVVGPGLLERPEPHL
eukprot:3364331-Lingulodinium_polyedra.AAC.2